MRTIIQLEFNLLEQPNLVPTSTPVTLSVSAVTETPTKEKGLSHNDAFGAFLATIQKGSKLTLEEETKLLAVYQNNEPGAEKALETLMLSNQRIVVSMSKRYSRFGCPLEDLVSEANIGLHEAIRKFDPAKGHRIGAYAVWWIKQYLRKALTENCRTIRIPICQQQTVRTIHATASKLTELTGSYPTDEEIAEEAGLDPFKVQNLRNLTVPMMSLQTPVGDHSGREVRTYEDILSDQSGAGESPLEALSRKNGGETLNILIRRRLNQKEQEVIKLRFGLEGTEGSKTLEEVGAKLRLTRERIRQIQDQALQKLRRTLVAEQSRMPTLLSILPARLA